VKLPTRLLLASLLVCASARAEDDEAMGRRVQALLRAHQGDVFGCVQSEPAPPKGEMLVRVLIGDRGEPGRVDVLKDATGSKTLERCIADKVRAWDLAPLGGAPGDQVVFPLAFRPDERAGVRLEARTVERGQRESGELALFVVRGRVKLGAETLGPGDLAWSVQPAALERVGREVPLVVAVTAEEGTLGGHPVVVRKDAAKSYPIAGGQGSATIYLDGLNEPLAIDQITARAGTKVPAHQHAGSDELLYIVSGKGMTTIGGKPVFSAAGTILRIPAGVEHSLSVDEPLVALQVYAPGGPEQRFKNSNGGSR
jgi:mannose-6-phosphate isomerase-like protein (cupin superfamily)